MAQDDRIISFQRHPSVDDALNEKQPLKEHLLNDCNLPDFADHNAFAKTSVAKAQHFLTGSPRYLTSHAAAGLENSIDSCKPKISLLARYNHQPKPPQALDQICCHLRIPAFGLV